ncbi:endolysin [Synechococcus phage P60]|uniref:Glycoside hydrolase (Lysozyme) n=1 Tax=Synechococcus phage P60 TaxID=2905923 RepID=Q8W6X9_9CAUD|nr:endolysin [Synechococcus phage P60]AAL73300.2 glycoside hydrolase (lysozyme) [Synechococcus phage P60]
MALRDAAKYYKELPHQQAAWDELEARLPAHVVDEFLQAYRSAPEAPQAPVGGLISHQTLEDLTGYRKELFTQLEVDDFNRLLRETGFDKDLDATRMLVANILHETANLKYMKEIASGWAYEGRSDLGNVHPGDGPRYKGAGVLQLTGRYNYSRLSKALADPRVMEGVDYVSTTYPFMSALTWIKENRLLAVAQTQGFDAVCRRINGGWNGYEDRLSKYRLCQRVL